MRRDTQRNGLLMICNDSGPSPPRRCAQDPRDLVTGVLTAPGAAPPGYRRSPLVIPAGASG